MSHEDDELQRLAVYDLGRIANALEQLARTFGKRIITDFELHQINSRGESMPITGTVVGTTSTFNIGFVPATNFVPLLSGPTVTVDDPTVVLTPVDASNNFTASVPAASTGKSYNLTIAGTNGDGLALSHVFNIPIQPVAPPPPVQITDFSLNQVS